MAYYAQYLVFNDETQEWYFDFGSQERIAKYFNDIRLWAGDIDWTQDLHEQLADGQTIEDIAREYAKDGVDNWDVYAGFQIVWSDETRAEVTNDLTKAIIREIENWLEDGEPETL